MARLFSYVVDHDDGYAPNPFGGYCSLVHCKFKGRRGRRRNIVELANVGDWVLGTGGKSHRSSGNGTIIYLMRIDFKPTFSEYLKNRRFRRRYDAEDLKLGNEFALVSSTFFYFGSEALPISKLPPSLRQAPLEKWGQGFRSDFTEQFVRRFTTWFQANYPTGQLAPPCAPDYSLIPKGACKEPTDQNCRGSGVNRCVPRRPRCRTMGNSLHVTC